MIPLQWRRKRCPNCGERDTRRSSQRKWLDYVLILFLLFPCITGPLQSVESRIRICLLTESTPPRKLRCLRCVLPSATEDH